MLIVDELKALAARVGVTATGNNIQEVIISFRAGLDAKEAAQKKTEAPVAKFESTEPIEEPIIKPRRDKKKSKSE